MNCKKIFLICLLKDAVIVENLRAVVISLCIGIAYLTSFLFLTFAIETLYIIVGAQADCEKYSCSLMPHFCVRYSCTMSVLWITLAVAAVFTVKKAGDDRDEI